MRSRGWKCVWGDGCLSVCVSGVDGTNAVRVGLYLYLESFARNQFISQDWPRAAASTCVLHSAVVS